MWIPALLYIPDKVAGKVPVILNLSGHESEGKVIAHKQLRCINQAKRGMLALNVEWLGTGQLSTKGFAHERMSQLDVCGASGLTPVLFVNEVAAWMYYCRYPTPYPQRVAVTGLSGGGWQTIVISALDTRITLANPVAGYSSFLMRTDYATDLGDQEQTPVDLATVADYCHLTAMLARRRTLLTYNFNDNCCFAVPHALPPLIASALPAFRLYGKAENLRTHVNHDPGTHNFEVDNRQHMYRLLGDFFYPNDTHYSADEILSQEELQTADRLNVPLPADNLDFHKLALKLIKHLPNEDDLPVAQDRRSAWQEQRRASLRLLVAYRPLTVEPLVIDRGQIEGYQCVWYSLHLDNAWTVPAVELRSVAGRTNATSLVLADLGRASLAEETRQLLDQGQRVIAIDPFYLGESQFPHHAYLYALLLATIGDRPIGLQASEIAAISRWAAQDAPGHQVNVVTVGPRTSLMALIAAAVEPSSMGQLQLTGCYESLRQVIFDNMAYNDAPEMFCFSLLEQFDIPGAQAAYLPAQD